MFYFYITVIYWVLLRFLAQLIYALNVNDSYFIEFSTKAKTDCLYFDISRFIIRCRYIG